DGVRVARDLGDLVGPPGVPDPPVDRGAHRGLGTGPGEPLAGPDVGDELRPPSLEQLRDPVQHLATVVRRRTGPPRLRGAGRADGVARVLAGGHRRVRQERAARRAYLVGAARLRAGERPAHVELVGLADVDAPPLADHRHRTSPSTRYGPRPCRPPSRPYPDSL